MSAEKVTGDVSGFIDVVRAHASTDERLKFAANKDDVSWEAIGDGNLNDVVRLYSKEESASVVIKYAPPFIKCLGPDHPLGVERGTTEYNALNSFFSLVPGCCPEPYFYDVEKRVICMEDLKDYVVFRKQLIQGVCDENVVQGIARDIAVVHAETHTGKLQSSEFDSLKQKFGHTELVNITNKYVFTGPFDRNEITNRCSTSVREHLHSIYDDDQVLSAARRMKKIFLEKKECLVHGDLHTGSIMVAGTLHKFIDLEFAYVGPGAVDVGFLVANYIFSYYQHMSTEENHNHHRQFAYSIINICKETVNTYLKHMTSFTGDRKSYEEHFLTEVAGFAGCEIIRRIVGAAHVEDLDNRPYAEVDCLAAGVRLLKAFDKIQTADRMVVIAFMLL